MYLRCRFLLCWDFREPPCLALCPSFVILSYPLIGPMMLQRKLRCSFMILGAFVPARCLKFWFGFVLIISYSSGVNPRQKPCLTLGSLKWCQLLHDAGCYKVEVQVLCVVIFWGTSVPKFYCFTTIISLHPYSIVSPKFRYFRHSNSTVYCRSCCEGQLSPFWLVLGSI